MNFRLEISTEIRPPHSRKARFYAIARIAQRLPDTTLVILSSCSEVVTNGGDQSESPQIGLRSEDAMSRTSRELERKSRAAEYLDEKTGHRCDRCPQMTHSLKSGWFVEDAWPSRAMIQQRILDDIEQSRGAGR